MIEKFTKGINRFAKPARVVQSYLRKISFGVRRCLFRNSSIISDYNFSKFHQNSIIFLQVLTINSWIVSNLILYL